ncbi:branched-chain amino acid ABC transporter substrate-binding protein [Actinoalloteichus caeruleus]|uniref:branched-chain amino acid ABC transporter substrate-binding protein n=1 Tax=Actinoalloteichus cyanogriseus TaxID=2893586 RepID=UPI0004AA3015|nr:branched-chain amino acid ABC transporter substrate-binding protein [Actinoalloteichus caeruleus]
MSKIGRLRILAVAATASLTLAGCAQGGNEEPAEGGAATNDSAAAAPDAPTDAVLPAGDGTGECEDGVSIAYIGTIAGQNAALGVAILNGVRLAVEEHNEANAGCQVTLKEFDTEGSPDRASGVVTQAINDDSILGVVGLPFSGESDAAGQSFHEAGLVTISPSATDPALSQNGWDTFFRGLGNDAQQGPAAATFIGEDLGAESVCVVNDDSSYGIGLAREVREALGDAVVCTEEVKTNQREFSAVVGTIEASGPDAVFYAGYYTEAAPFAQQLFARGLQTTLVAPDGVRDDQFVQNAVGAAEGVYLTCPCVPADGFGDFFDAFTELAGTEPSTYSAEGYDATTVLLRALDEGLSTREEVLEYVRDYDAPGLTKHFKWDEDGELTDTPVWVYQVEDGEIVRDREIG